VCQMVERASAASAAGLLDQSFPVHASSSQSSLDCFTSVHGQAQPLHLARVGARHLCRSLWCQTGPMRVGWCTGVCQSMGLSEGMQQQTSPARHLGFALDQSEPRWLCLAGVCQSMGLSEGMQQQTSPARHLGYALDQSKPRWLCPAGTFDGRVRPRPTHLACAVGSTQPCRYAHPGPPR
jgi:hypothetical protein